MNGQRQESARKATPTREGLAYVTHVFVVVGNCGFWFGLFRSSSPSSYVHLLACLLAGLTRPGSVMYRSFVCLAFILFLFTCSFCREREQKEAAREAAKAQKVAEEKQRKKEARRREKEERDGGKVSDMEKVKTVDGQSRSALSSQQLTP